MRSQLSRFVPHLILAPAQEAGQFDERHPALKRVNQEQQVRLRPRLTGICLQMHGGRETGPISGHGAQIRQSPSHRNARMRSSTPKFASSFPFKN
jgi:hypothetical protein